jgi:hypothetical protein
MIDTAVTGEAVLGDVTEGPILDNDWEKLQWSIRGRN